MWRVIVVVLMLALVLESGCTTARQGDKLPVRRAADVEGRPLVQVAGERVAVVRIGEGKRPVQLCVELHLSALADEVGALLEAEPDVVIVTLNEEAAATDGADVSREFLAPLRARVPVVLLVEHGSAGGVIMLDEATDIAVTEGGRIAWDPRWLTVVKGGPRARRVAEISSVWSWRDGVDAGQLVSAGVAGAIVADVEDLLARLGVHEPVHVAQDVAGRVSRAEREGKARTDKLRQLTFEYMRNIQQLDRTRAERYRRAAVELMEQVAEAAAEDPRLAAHVFGLRVEDLDEEIERMRGWVERVGR